MPYQWKFRSYRRRFKQALQTSHGSWTVREGVILRLVDHAGNIGWGEIAPIPWFGSETLEQALAFCHQLPAILTDDLIFAVPDMLPSCQFAFESAWEGLQESTIGQAASQRYKDAENQAAFVTTSSTLRPQNSNVAVQNSTLRDQSSDIAVQSSTLRPQNSELPPQNSTLRDQSSIIAVQSSELRDQSSTLQLQNSDVAVQNSALRDQSSDIAAQNSNVAVQNLIRQPQSPVIAAPIPSPLPTPHSPLPTPYSPLPSFRHSHAQRL